jgi:hypothetical protein
MCGCQKPRKMPSRVLGTAEGRLVSQERNKRPTQVPLLQAFGAQACERRIIHQNEICQKPFLGGRLNAADERLHAPSSPNQVRTRTGPRSEMSMSEQ